MLHVVVTTADHKMGFSPDDLAADLEPTGFQTLSHSNRLHTRMPDIGHRSGKQVPGFAPIGPIVVANGSDRTVRLPKGRIAPFGLIVDAIGRIGHHQHRRMVATKWATSVALVASPHRSRCASRMGRMHGPTHQATESLQIAGFPTSLFG